MSTVIGNLKFTCSDNENVNYINLAKSLNKYSWSDAQSDSKMDLFNTKQHTLF